MFRARVAHEDPGGPKPERPGGTRHRAAEVPIATPAALVLLKLEAGGPTDLQDVIALVGVQRTLNGAPWLAEVEAAVGTLQPEARARWARLAPDLQS